MKQRCASCGEDLPSGPRGIGENHCNACLEDIARMIGDGLANEIHPSPQKLYIVPGDQVLMKYPQRAPRGVALGSHLVTFAGTSLDTMYGTFTDDKTFSALILGLSRDEKGWYIPYAD